MFLNDLKNRLQPTAVPTLVTVSRPVRTSPRKQRYITGTATGNRSRSSKKVELTDLPLKSDGIGKLL